jgi:dienelactone hydrolase
LNRLGKHFRSAVGNRGHVDPVPMPSTHARLAVAGAALIISGLFAAACGGSSQATPRIGTPGTGTPTAGHEAVSSTEFSGSGPYAAGTFQYDVNGDPVVVWYPATKSGVLGREPYTYHLRAWLPAAIQGLIPPSFPDGVTEDAYWGVRVAPGSFPVVLFSHGYGGYPDQSSFLTAHLATWGMIVVAADQLKRDLSAVILGHASGVEPKTDVSEQLAALTYVKKLDATHGSLLFGHLDSSMIATLGHSAGGGTAVLVAAADPAVRGWIALAGVPVTPPSKPVPSLMISGSLDKTVPTSTVRTFYDSVAGHKTFLVIDGYGHNVFDDICTINHAHGGVVAGVKELHLPVPPALLQLATDGCSPPDTYPPSAWPLIDEAVTAQLRYDFGDSSTSLGTSASIDRAFPGIHAQISTAD